MIEGTAFALDDRTGTGDASAADECSGSVANPGTTENAARQRYVAALIVNCENFTYCEIPRPHRPAMSAIAS